MNTYFPAKVQKSGEIFGNYILSALIFKDYSSIKDKWMQNLTKSTQSLYKHEMCEMVSKYLRKLDHYGRRSYTQNKA